MKIPKGCPTNQVALMVQVLYLFLEFFSSFDWDKYCVSLSSPILLASFSEDTERQSIVSEDFQRLGKPCRPFRVLLLDLKI